MTNKDWEVGPVLKDKPGSQGTLLRGGTRYSSDARFPRGYTPERLHEVADAVNNWNSGPGANKGARANTYRDYEYRTPPDFLPSGRHDAEPHRRLVDNIARSTVPVSDITNAEPGRRTHFWVSRRFDGEMEQKEQAGTHTHHPPGHSNRHDIFIATPYVGDTTPIHEIGHHVSHMTGQHAGYSTDTERGQEEAFADNYAEKHFRDRRGKQQDVGTYAGGPSAGRRSEEFFKSYYQHRDHSMYQKYVTDDNAKFYRKYPEEEQGRDGTHQEPLISKPYTSEGEEPEMHINEDALPRRKEWWEE